jgi:hypothetical protein
MVQPTLERAMKIVTSRAFVGGSVETQQTFARTKEKKNTGTLFIRTAQVTVKKAKHNLQRSIINAT